MRRRLIPLVAVLALAACGGDGGDGGADKAGGSTATGSGGSASPAQPPQFDRVKSFTLDHFKGDSAVAGECRKLAWVEDPNRKGALLPAFPGTTRTEVLTCDDVPYVVYLEYRDAASAQRSLASVQLPYFLAQERIAVTPLVAVDDAPRSRYLAALKTECACGEVVNPKPAQ
jgi:hypothetical protein